MGFETAQVSLPNDTDVTVLRAFKGPRELVWRAHTEPALMQRWLRGPPGWSMSVCDMDLRVGGAYLWRWRNDEDGKEFGFHGEFTEIDAPRRLAHTQFYDPGDIGGDMGGGAVIELTLAEADGGTLLTCHMIFRSKPERDAAFSTGMTDGMEQSYQRLDALQREFA